MNYYNEHDEQAAQWLRNLIAAGLIPRGDVDTRSIEDVIPSELHGYTQCHFFAGIGGWSYALALAGWPSDVWTGSCPCQPFSAAGKGDGFADERHLWPAWFHLIRECRPNVVFGEQVASAIRHGWLDLVSADLEGQGYAVGGAVLGAHSVGAPHIRQRLYWVADSSGDRWGQSGRDTPRSAVAPGERSAVELRDGGALGRVEHAELQRERPTRQLPQGAGNLARAGEAVRLAEPYSAGLQPWQRDDQAARHGDTAAATSGNDRHGSASAIYSQWRDADWLLCRDGKWRPVAPGTFPLAHGIPARVVRLRPYGNAIVPQVAAAFVRAAM